MEEMWVIVKETLAWMSEKVRKEYEKVIGKNQGEEKSIEEQKAEEIILELRGLKRELTTKYNRQLGNKGDEEAWR